MRLTEDRKEGRKKKSERKREGRKKWEKGAMNNIVTETTMIHFITQKYCGCHYLQSAIYLTFRSTVEKVHNMRQTNLQNIIFIH